MKDDRLSVLKTTHLLLFIISILTGILTDSNESLKFDDSILLYNFQKLVTNTAFHILRYGYALLQQTTSLNYSPNTEIILEPCWGTDSHMCKLKWFLLREKENHLRWSLHNKQYQRENNNNMYIFTVPAMLSDIYDSQSM